MTLNISTESFLDWNISELFPTRSRLLHYFIIFRS